ncbi:unnamed protein product, partial [Allacma fusca]
MCAEYEEQIAREIKEKTPPQQPQGQLGFTHQLCSSSTMANDNTVENNNTNQSSSQAGSFQEKISDLSSSSEPKAPGTPTLYGYS